MTVITIEKCKNAKVNTVKVGNKELFWIRIIDIQNGLGLKNMSDLVRKEIHGIFSTDKATNKQIKEYKRSLQEFFFFLTAIWLTHGQLWAILRGTASLTRC